MAVEVVNDQEFQDHLSSGSKFVVKYYADWCGSCRLFKPKFRRLSESEDYSEIKFLDVNAEENQEARKAAGVTNLPYFAVFSDGNLVEGLATNKEEAVVELINRIK